VTTSRSARHDFLFQELPWRFTKEKGSVSAMVVAFRSAPALAKISFLLSTTETRFAMERRISFWGTNSAKATPILFLWWWIFFVCVE
jgi:hypothetical protein